jgi:hypothetical protein
MKTDGYRFLGRLAGHEVGVDHTLGGKNIPINQSEFHQRMVFTGGRLFSARARSPRDETNGARCVKRIAQMGLWYCSNGSLNGWHFSARTGCLYLGPATTSINMTIASGTAPILDNRH